MFKIESYITPLLMGYVDKYVKLRPEDFQLSLWGGDVVLNNLDLRLDVIERAIELPIIFKSGHIHELRIHVPWTKLGSEPVVITINTIECILKLRDTAYDESRSSRSRESRRSRVSPQKLKQQGSDDLPPGYLQSLINKILNNVSIIVNNLILKFVEDDIVLSLNVKSAEVYSVDNNWNRAFTELVPPELALRKSINFCDLTVCLDKCDASGKIENYQDPLMYRCSVTGRVYMKYDSQNAKRASVTKFDLFCDKLDVSLTDLQLPMFLRLIELCLALYYGTMEFPSPPESVSVEPSMEEMPGNDEDADESQSPESPDEQGWASWAWSYVPQILPKGEEEEGEADVTAHRRKRQPGILSIGMYAHKATLTFKLTEKIREKVHYGPHKVLFKPFLLLEGEGIALEILLKGITFFDVQFGVTNIHLQCQGHCICGDYDEDDTRSKTILQGGSSLNDKVINYYSQSLFDIGCNANQGRPLEFIMDGPQRLQVFTEQAGIQRFGVIYQNYLYIMQEPEDSMSNHGSNLSSVSDSEDAVFLRETSLLRFIIGSCHCNVSSSSVHRIQKLLHCAYNHSYEPYAKHKEEIVDESRPHPTPSQVANMEENLPTRTQHLTILHPIITIYHAEHDYCDVKKKSYKSRSKTSSRVPEKDKASEMDLPCILLTASRFDLQSTNPMYPRKLVRLVSKLAGPSSNLLHHCHSHIQTKLFEASVGLVTMDKLGERSHPVTIVAPFSGALYTRKLLLTMYWKNSHLTKIEQVYELPQATIGVSKPNVLLSSRVVSSWKGKKPCLKSLKEDSLLQDVFDRSKRHEKEKRIGCQPVVEISLNGLEWKKCRTSSSLSYTGTLSSIQSILYNGSEGRMTPLLSCPVDTSHLHTPEFYRSSVNAQDNEADFITFSYQCPIVENAAEVPNVFLLNIEGCVGAVDASLTEWFSYSPQLLKKTSRSESIVTVDQALAEATSPLQKNTKALSSNGSVTQKTGSFTRTTSQVDTQTATVQTSQKLTTDKVTESSLETSEQGWSSQITALFPYIRMMQVQVDIKSSVMYFCDHPLMITDPVTHIPSNLKQVLSHFSAPGILAVCLPQVHINSAGLKPLAPLQEIPIGQMEGTIIGEKLPWAMQLDNFSIYTMRGQEELFPILKPVSVGCTIAVSSKFNPPTSDTISALGLCLHTDMRAIEVSISKEQSLQNIVDKQTLHRDDLSTGRTLSSTKEALKRLKVNLTIEIAKQIVLLSEHLMTLQKAIFMRKVSSSTSSALPSHNQGVNEVIETAHSVTEDFLFTTTDTSGITTSRETTHSQDLEIDGTLKDRVKLSLWLQWTLPKAKVSFYHLDGVLNKESKVRLMFEEMSMSVDVQEVYAKVKATCGSCNCHHFYRRTKSGFEWCVGPYLGTIMTCRKEISEDVTIIADRLSRLDVSASSVKTGNSNSRDVAHGFMDLTFTRALCKNVAKKMRKLNMDMQLFQEMEGSEVSYDLYFHRYISELCCNIEPCDIIMYIPVFKTVFSCFDAFMSPSTKSEKKKSYGSSTASSSNVKFIERSSVPFITSSNIPLLYVTIGSVRIFIPTSDILETNSVEEKVTEKRLRHNFMSTLSNNLMVAMVHNISVNPQADNPLPRYAIEKDLYHKALQLGLTQQPGSAIENRQYQVDIKGMAVCTGFWNDFAERSMIETSNSQAHPTVQIPALEWNSKPNAFQGDHSPIQLVSMISTTDLKVIAAPAIVFKSQSPESTQVLVCGHSLEVNVTNKLDIFLSTNQVLLMKTLIDQSCEALSVIYKSKGKASQRPDNSVNITEGSYDSGIGSENITANENASKPRKESKVQGNVEKPLVISPFDALLTANVITCTLYKHEDVDYKEIPRSSNKDDSQQGHAQNDFGTASKPSSHDTDQGKIVPYVYFLFSQPHTVLSCQKEGQKFEMSCYDITIKGSDKEFLPLNEYQVLPEWSSFDVFWFETRPGQSDPKTGIPPSLYTLRITNFLFQQADISMLLERPLKFNLSVDKLQKILKFIQEISTVKEREESKKSYTSDKVNKPTTKDPAFKSVQSICSKISSVHLHSQQIVIALDNHWSSQQTGMLGNVENVKIDAAFNSNSKAVTDKISLDLQFRNTVINTSYEKQGYPFLDPVSLNAHVDLMFLDDADGVRPRMVTHLYSGLATLHFGQAHAMCFQSIMKQIQDFTLQNSKQSMREKSKIPDTEVQHNMDPVLTIQDSSRDDLRTGKFEYTMNPSNDIPLEPKPGEIIFCNKDENRDSCMAWCYTVPRVISLVHFTPIPFNISSNESRESEVQLLIPCVLQYYEEATQVYLDYIEFDLSENSETKLQLPDLRAHNVRELVSAQRWRVLVKNGVVIDHSDNDDKNDISQIAILPASLAASMRVDSAYLPSLIPSLQTYMNMAGFHLKLSNHFKLLSKEIPHKLEPFMLSDDQPDNQEFATLTLASPTMISSHVTGSFARDLIQLSGEISLDVTEYRNLTTQNVVRPCNMYGDISLSNDRAIPMLECNMNSEPLFMKFGRGVVHTLNNSQQAWNQINCQEPTQRILLNHFFICNDTCHNIRFGQVGTDENIALLPREMHAYSWRTHKSKQSLHVCIDGKVWKWCEPFCVDEVGTLTRVVKSFDQNYSLIVYVKAISNVQKQIIIRGQLLIASRLSVNLEVKVTATDCYSQIKELTYNLQAEEVTPSYILDPEKIHCIKVRPIVKGAEWSDEIHITGEKFKDNSAIKIPLENKQRFHIWSRIFIQSMGAASQIVILLSPLYVLKSHLPSNLYVHIDMPKSKESDPIEVPGQGRQLQLQCPGGDTVNKLLFQLSPSSEKTMTSVSLSTDLIDQVDRSSPDKMDIDSLLTDWKKEGGDIWPYCFTPDKHNGERSIGPVEECSQESQAMGYLHYNQLPSVNMHIRMTEFWPQCNTLLVDLLPWCLMTNQSSVDIIVIQTNGSTWQLAAKKTFVPPKLDAFSIGVLRDANLHQSMFIPLSEEEVEQQRYRPDKETTLFLDGYVQTKIMVKKGDQHQLLYPFTIQSTIKEHIRVISIHETYSVSNLCKYDIISAVHFVPSSAGKVSLQHTTQTTIPSHARCKATDSDITPVISWILPKGSTITQGKDTLTSYMSIKHTEQSDWSLPFQLIANESGLKTTCAMPVSDHEFDTVPLCLTGHEKNGLIYYVIHEDASPSFLLYNRTAVPIVFGHQYKGLATGDMSIQEGTEQLEQLPSIAAGKSCFYTPSSVSKALHNTVGSRNFPKLLFGFYQASNNEKSEVVWSKPIDVNTDFESFVPIPQGHDVKVKVKCVCMITHITIEPISKAEISAKEVRNRIRGKDTAVVISHIEEGFLPLDVQKETILKSNARSGLAQRKKSHMQICVGAYFQHLCLVLQDEVSSTDKISEVVQLCIDNMFLSHLPSLGKDSEDLNKHTCYSVCIGSIQIDNQLFYTQGLYDFPVLLIQQKENGENFADIGGLNVIEKQAVIKSCSFAHIQVVMETDCLNNSVIKTLEVSMHPVAVNIEDSFIYRILREIEGLIPIKLSVMDRKKAVVKTLPKSFKSMSKTLFCPLRIEQLCIQPVNVLLSVHASLKLFLASDKTPLSFGKIEKKYVCTTSHQLTKVLVMHYASGALFRAGIVVGSLEILGNPTGLVRSIGTGVADLFKLPYSGLTKGPGAFVTGVSSGMSSFIRNISSGMLTSVANFASSVSRNMDRLSLDTVHREQQEERRRRQPDGISSGLKQGLTGFGISLLGAVAGLADQPLQTVISAGQTTTESPLSPASGIVKGVGKGIVGVFTKPIGGAAEFVSQTGQGLLHGTGLAERQPKSRYPPESVMVHTANNSSLKCQMKLLQSLPSVELLMVANASFIDLMDPDVKVQLLLTNELLIIINVEDDVQQQAFSLAEIEIPQSEENEEILTLLWRDSQNRNNTCQIHEANKQRVEAFIDGALEYVQVSPPGTPPLSDSQSDASFSPDRVAMTPKYHFRIDHSVRLTFVQLVYLIQNRLQGKGFPVI